MWLVCAPEVAPGQNAPQGVESAGLMILNPVTGGNNTL